MEFHKLFKCVKTVVNCRKCCEKFYINSSDDHWDHDCIASLSKRLGEVCTEMQELKFENKQLKEELIFEKIRN